MPKSGQIWNAEFLRHEPLFTPFEPFCASLREPNWPCCDTLTELVERQRFRAAAELAPLRFVEKPKKPRRQKRRHLDLRELYDGSIALRGQVPCLHASYHDLLNAIVFAAFPRSKRALHARQYSALERWVPKGEHTLPGKRTREQDALTIFDEGGVVLLMTDAFRKLWERSTERQVISAWSPASGVLPLLFGHALLEHLLEGHRSLRASGVVLSIDVSFEDEAWLDCVDRELCARLEATSEFTAPGADSIFELEPSGQCWIGPPKPSWREWNEPPARSPRLGQPW